MVLDTISNLGGNVLSGVIGGIIGAGLKEISQYVWGWHQAGNHQGADFHIAATMYPEINPDDPTHKGYLPALEQGKTHVQEMIWLGGEIPLNTFLSNRYFYRQVKAAMSRAKDAGLLIGDLPERVERPLLKKISGFHNTIPSNDIVKLYKKHVGVADGQRVIGISPPTHEHYKGSPHRRVLRAMFVADSQLEQGLPPAEKILFRKETHGTRYQTLTTIIEDYRKNQEKYKDVKVFF